MTSPLARYIGYTILLILSFTLLNAKEKNHATVITEQNKQKSQSVRERVFNVLDFGAVGDGKTLNTNALQKAIDTCSKAGGGLITFPSGQYVTGTIELKSNIILSFAHEAILLGSTDLKDYPTKGMLPSREGPPHCLLYAANAKNITLEGLGTIDGRGKPQFFPRNSGPNNADHRPRIIRFENCTNVTLSGLTYRDPAFWGIHLVDCKDVHINAVTVRFIENHTNNDGIDIDSCERVLVENCDIKAGDDSICLKSSLGPCRDITVRNCRVSSHTSPLKFGTSSRGGFINVVVTNCYFYDCPMGAIKLLIVDGGRMENIKISHIVMDNVGCPLFIRLGNRGLNFEKSTEAGPNGKNINQGNTTAGTIKGIHISDLEATVTFQDRARKAAHDKKLYGSNGIPATGPLTTKEKAKAGPIMISGIPGHYIEDVTLENIKISYPGQGTEAEAKNTPPEDITKYPEQFFFGVLPSWGAYIRHAKNVTLTNVELTTRNDDARKRIILDDVEGFEEK